MRRPHAWFTLQWMRLQAATMAAMMREKACFFRQRESVCSASIWQWLHVCIITQFQRDLRKELMIRNAYIYKRHWMSILLYRSISCWYMGSTTFAIHASLPLWSPNSMYILLNLWLSTLHSQPLPILHYNNFNYNFNLCFSFQQQQQQHWQHFATIPPIWRRC